MHTQASSLSEITWNFLLNALPNRACLIEQPELLAQLRVPRRFAGRVH